MAESVGDAEVAQIWKRTKFYLDLSLIDSATRAGIADDINSAMRRSTSPSFRAGSIETLITAGFPERMSDVDEIFNELAKERIKEIKVRGVARFQLAAGTDVINFEGKRFRGGSFISGRSMEEALENLGGFT